VKFPIGEILKKIKKKNFLTLGDFKRPPHPPCFENPPKSGIIINHPKKANGPIFVKFWKRFFRTHPPLPKIQPANIPNFGVYVQHKIHPNRTFFLAQQLLVAQVVPI
jgi:hypothetical protein